MREEESDARVLQPQHAHIRSHSHLAQAIRMEIELVVYPVSEVLCERVFVSRGSAQGGWGDGPCQSPGTSSEPCRAHSVA